MEGFIYAFPLIVFAGFWLYVRHAARQPKTGETPAVIAEQVAPWRRRGPLLALCLGGLAALALIAGVISGDPGSAVAYALPFLAFAGFWAFMLRMTGRPADDEPVGAITDEPIDQVAETPP
jgi:hypothetical protein